MKKRWKILIGVGVVLVATGIAFSGMFLADQKKYQDMVADKTSVPMWEADPKPLTSEAEYTKRLTEVMKKNGEGFDINSAAKNSIVIPGLRGAWSIDFKTKKPDFGTDWVPQGVTQNPKNYFVSMYDGDKKLNSILVQIDKATKKYVKTIILNDKAHVGGITYDYDRDILWWSNDDVDAVGGLSSIPLETLEAYDAKKLKRPIVSNYHAIDWLRRTSSIVYHDNQIVVTVYGRKKDDRGLYAIPVDPATGFVRTFADLSKKQLQGIADSTSIQNFIDTLIKDQLIQSMAPAWDRVQGLSIAHTGLSLFSQSNGYSPSVLWLEIPNNKSGQKFAFSPPKNWADHLYFPPSVEQTSLQKPHDDKMALVFESGAKKYRQRLTFLNRPMMMDRLLIINMAIESIK